MSQMPQPPGFIEILLPVWGERYTRDFLELSLPSLLAPGNLPALASLGKCTFVLLATARDADVIQKSSLWQLLLDCCSVRVIHIDDPASSSSSTVLTLAYGLAIRSAGKRALDTCFVPLVADYVMADGSLLAVVMRIYAGASGVLAGNFQIEGELAYPRLQERKSPTGVLAIAPRSLVEMSLNALHPLTVGEIVNENRGLKPETNRLFWRVNENCMVGRFFLMHMIAIRPERLDFVIAAPSDYSLIPELCPSGQIVRMTDSDEYFVVECQPRGEAPGSTVPGRVEPRSFAKALAMWATTTHRDNARHTLIFHAEASPRCLAEAVAVSEAFVREVETYRDEPPKPFRHHPSWSRALDYHIATAQREPDLAQLAWITGDESLTKGRAAAGRFRAVLLGRAPNFRPWHPRWPDVRMLKLNLAAARGDVAFVSNASARVRTWLDRLALGQGGRSVTHFRTADIRDLPDARADRQEARFDSLFLIADKASAEAAQELQRLAPLMKPGGVLVLAVGQLFAETEAELRPIVMPREGTFSDNGLSLQRTTCVAEGTWRVAIQSAMMQYARKATRDIGLRTPVLLVMAGGLAAISMFFNIAGDRGRKFPKGARLSSLFFTMRRVEF
jgi:hypothetical protein